MFFLKLKQLSKPDSAGVHNIGKTALACAMAELPLFDAVEVVVRLHDENEEWKVVLDEWVVRGVKSVCLILAIYSIGTWLEFKQ